jgi:hypothetical protein
VAGTSSVDWLLSLRCYFSVDIVLTKTLDKRCLSRSCLVKKLNDKLDKKYHVALLNPKTDKIVARASCALRFECAYLGDFFALTDLP